MSYTDFTLETVESQLGVRVRAGDLFPGLVPVPVPDWLRTSLDRGMELAMVSEKARSEFIVSPILLACRELSGRMVAIFSGQRLDVDPGRGLSGECDFVLSPVRADTPAAGPDRHCGRGEEERHRGGVGSVHRPDGRGPRL